MRCRRPIRIAAVLAMIAVFLAAGGCGLYSEMRFALQERDTFERRADKRFRKTVALTAFENRTPYQKDGFKDLFQKGLTRTLTRKCGDYRFMSPGDPDYPEFLTDPPRLESGLMDTQPLALAGRKYGIHAVVTGHIFDISGKEERKGLWWFRETRSYVQFTLMTAVFEMETGAKILDQSRGDQIRMDAYDIDIMKADGIVANEDLEAEIRDAAGKLGKQVCKALKQVPWVVYVTEVGDRVRISAGEWDGVKQGQLFNIYDNARIFEGEFEQDFFVPGDWIGQIKITGVTEDTAEGELIAGDPPEIGDSVKPTRKKRKN